MNPFLKEEESLDDILTDILKESYPNLGKKIYKLEESDKTAVSKNVITRLFNDIRSKALSADFSFIDKSMGDVNRIKELKAVGNALTYLKQLDSIELNNTIEDINTAYMLLYKYNREFKNGYIIKNEMTMFFFSAIVVSVIQATSYIISTVVTYEKDQMGIPKPTIVKGEISKIHKHNQIKAIRNLIKLEKKGKLRKAFKEFQSKNEDIISAIVTTITVTSIIISVLLFIRLAIFVYYNTRIVMSEYLDQMSKFVEINANNIKDGKKAKERQLRLAEKLKKLSDKLAVDAELSSDKAGNDEKTSNKTIGSDEVDNDSSDDNGEVVF